MSDISGINLKVRPLYHQTPLPKSKNLKTPEQETQEHIQILSKQLEQTEHELNRQAEMRRDEYSQINQEQDTKFQQTQEEQRSKGNEENRQLQQKQEAELNKIRRDGEREIARTKTYYNNQMTLTNQKGEKDLSEQKRNTAMMSNFEEKKFLNAFVTQKTERERLLKQNNEDLDQKYTTITENSQKQYERIKENSLNQTNEADAKYQEQYENLLKTQNQSIQNLDTKATQMLNNLRQSTAAKLDAYTNRQEDPFYQLIHLNAEIEENNDAFIVKANIPEYERDGLSVAVKGNQLVISGRRRNEEKLELSPEHNISTASYQSFSESLPLTQPVNGKLLTREFEGDKLVIYIPKAGARNNTYNPFKKADLEHVLAQKPDFPKNLPISHSLLKKDEPLT
ncbi:Hsp20 family protein [Candidatus Nomurabacteria bacterium]|nr:Hsp20 family protein [Candidatus Nomurabacteria bacterium]